MRIKERLDRLAKKKGLYPAEDRFEAYLEVFRMIYEREPTPEEMEELKEESLQKPWNIKQTIAEIEKMVYEGATDDEH